MCVALTIAGSEPSGGAGLQADLKTFTRFGVYGMNVVTLLTVGNTRGITRVAMMDVDLVRQQLESVLADIPVDAAKTGALGSLAMIDLVAEFAPNFSFPLVVDPVMVSKQGNPLIDADAVEILKRRLLPHAFVTTPNIPEAEALSGIEIGGVEALEEAARAIAALGPRHVIVKGGRLADRAVDVLWSDGEVLRFDGPHLDNPNTHGTGCVFSSALTSLLARGVDLSEAVGQAKRFVAEAIRTSPGLGRGCGPVNFDVPIAEA
ncbi:Hydroxymethylpyrimidine/phosphomethylpyrimidine kinase [Planctomycetes bacterium Pan216]|uniref:hydroxymethylpyrimidine kinase n=1 Tax=Kolteria novifilia TaxID=2527975 RepID=A0A518B344_9BACT|nr:Hydroxymethylpyrimidine/phosphomethylpyrimidine kinase [Planctomycetes bacterium Pan216]